MSLSILDVGALVELTTTVGEGALRAVQLTRDDEKGWTVVYIDDGEFNPYREEGHGATLAEAINNLKEA